MADFLAFFPDSADSNQIPQIPNQMLESAESAQDPLFPVIFSFPKKPGFAKNPPTWWSIYYNPIRGLIYNTQTKGDDGRGVKPVVEGVSLC
jgi:hypothetical protein